MTRSLCARYALAAVLTLMTSAAIAQYNDNPTLKVADPAPPIKVKTWLRGEPVTQFEKGKVYVLDFWATWCGGCIASFPHISAIADKYGDRVVFKSIDTGEFVADEKREKDPVAVVTEFLKTPLGTPLKLGVAVDGHADTMWNAWIKTLRRGGLPTTYVIDQEGHIAWVDVNLDHLEWVLDEVLAKRWDRQKAAAVMQQRDLIDDMVMGFGAWRGKQVPRTEQQPRILAASEAFEKQFPDRKDAVAMYKFSALMQLDQARLPALLEQVAADPRSRYIDMSTMGAMVVRQTGLPKPIYAATAKVMERCLGSLHPASSRCGKTVRVYETLATSYGLAGEPARAAASIEQALKLTGPEKTPEDQVRKLNEALVKYKAAAGGAG